MRLSDIKTSCNQLLEEAFEGTYKVYGNDSHDGYTRPAFFTELIPLSYRRTSKCAVSAAYSYKITFLEVTHDEGVCLDIVDTVQDAFGLLITCGDRHLTVQEVEFEWIDTNRDVLQITIDFAPFTVITPTDYYKLGIPLMQVLEMDVILLPSDYQINDLIAYLRAGRIRFYFDPAGHLHVRQPNDTEVYLSFSLRDGGSLSAAMTTLIDTYVEFEIVDDDLIAKVADTKGLEQIMHIHVE